MSPDYPLIDVVAKTGGGQLSQRMAPTSMPELIEKVWAGLAPLLSRAPRHLDRLATIAAQGRLTTRVRMFDRPGELSALERLVNRTLLTFLSIGVAAVSVMMITAEVGPTLAATDIPLPEVWGWAGLFVAVVLLLRVLLAIFRAEKPD